MESGMDYMFSKGERVVVLFYGKDKKNHCIRACNGDAILRILDCVFL